jgi:hypothetical protein
MKPVEIEEAISQLAQAPFDAQEFPYALLGLKAVKEKRVNSREYQKGIL